MKSKNNTVSITGFGPLIIRMAGIFSNVLFHFKFTMPEDSPLTAKIIVLSEGTVYKDSIYDLILLMADVILAMALQVLYKPVNRCFALLSIILRLVRTIIQGINMLYGFLFLRSYHYAGYFTISKPGPLHLSALQSFSGQHRQIIMG